ncbi:hypothetical protein [Actinoplanes campanulatus]|nr:hypothetical protein [Actinoplanes capillaceus]
MAAIGFLAGLGVGLMLHKARLWCGICGVTLECPAHGRGASACPPKR